MKHRLHSALVILALSGSMAFAQAFAPLPNPDPSRLSPAEIAELREARAAFDKAIVGKSGVALAELYGGIGAAYAHARLLDGARVAIDNAVLAAPLDDRWPYLQGALARVQGRYEQARAAFEQSIKLNGRYLPARIALADQLLRAGDVAGAGTLLSAGLSDHGREPVLRAMLAEVAYRQQRHKDAIADLEDALRLDPNATALYHALARAHKAAGDAKAAHESKAKAGNVPPLLDDPLLARLLPATVMAKLADADAPDAVQAARDARESAIGEAGALADAGKYAEARAALDKALAKHANDAALLSTYARIELADGRLDAAKARAAAATKTDPASAPAWMTQGYIAEVAADDAGARNAYQRAIAADPKMARAHVALGNLALRNGRAAEALEAYRAATAIEPGNPGYWAHLLAAGFVSGQCAGGLRESADNAKKHPRDPLFADLHIRAASTCPAATAEQRKAVLADAATLYRQAPEKLLAQVAETYALALAANGQWEDAAQTQGSAIYEAATLGDQVATAQYRELFQHFEARRMPTRPWAESHPLLKPQRPVLPSKPAATAPTNK